MSQHYSEKKGIFPMQGGCNCGHLRFEVALPPLLVHCCYCTACQRQTGSTFALNAILEASAVKLLPPAAPTIPGSPSDPAPAPCGLNVAVARLINPEAVALPASGGGDPVKPDIVAIPSQSTCGVAVAQCPHCHGAVWNHYADAGLELFYVRVGSLDRPWEITPDVHLFVKNRPPHIKTEDGKPEFDEYYPSRADLYRKDCPARVEAFKPKVEAWRAKFLPAFKS